MDPGRKHRLKCVAAPAPWHPHGASAARARPSGPGAAQHHASQHPHARALARAAAVPPAPHPTPVVACIGQLRAIACAVKCLQPPRTAASACHTGPGGGLAARQEQTVCGRQETDGGMKACVRGRAYLIALDCSAAAASNVEGRRHHPMKSSSGRWSWRNTPRMEIMGGSWSETSARGSSCHHQRKWALGRAPNVSRQDVEWADACAGARFAGLGAHRART